MKALILLLAIYGIYRLYCHYYIRIVEVWYVMVSDYLSLVEEAEILEEKPLSELPPRIIETNNFTAKYDPEHPKSFFDQLDLAYATLSDKYDLIKNRSSLFREEDWNDLQVRFSVVERIHNSVRYQRWRHFGLR